MTEKEKTEKKNEINSAFDELSEIVKEKKAVKDYLDAQNGKNLSDEEAKEYTSKRDDMNRLGDEMQQKIEETYDMIKDLAEANMPEDVSAAVLAKHSEHNVCDSCHHPTNGNKIDKLNDFKDEVFRLLNIK